MPYSTVSPQGVTPVYSAKGRNTGAAVVVILGGGFQVLAIDLEGTEICDWLTSRGVTCVLLKYRVPTIPMSGNAAAVLTTCLSQPLAAGRSEDHKAGARGRRSVAHRPTQGR